MRFPFRISASLCLLGLALVFFCRMAAAASSRDQRRLAGEVAFNPSEDPPSLDPTKQADTVSHAWLGHIYEGLVDVDAQGEPIPAAALSFTASKDGRQWQFQLRPDGQWHDGQPVTAEDFVYAWRRLVDPAYASEYANFAVTAGLRNAEAILKGRLPPASLGVRAQDSRTLLVELSRPVPYFLSLLAHQVFFPVRRDLVERFGARFAVDPASVIGNGPFRLVAWRREASLRLERFPAYWNAAAIRLNAIEAPTYVKDPQALFNNFRTGGVDLAGVSTPEVLNQALKAGMHVETYLSGCTRYLLMNARPGHPFADLRLRQAVRAGMSRREFVDKIIGIPGYRPLYGMVPDQVRGSDGRRTYRQEAPLKVRDADLQRARELIAHYRADHGGEAPPPVTLLSSDTTIGKKFAEYLQARLASILGSVVRVESVPFKTSLQRSRDGAFDIVLGGWCPDFQDPLTFMDLMESTNENNRSGWSSPRYDELIERARVEGNRSLRSQFFAEAEQLLLAEGPLVPLVQAGGAHLVAPGLNGMTHRTHGFNPDFRRASW